MLSRGMRRPRLVSSARFMEVAHAPPRDGRSAAWLAGPLASSRAARGAIRPVHGVVVTFRRRLPPPPLVDLAHDGLPAGLDVHPLDADHLLPLER